jgi:hypothetical protein
MDGGPRQRDLKRRFRESPLPPIQIRPQARFYVSMIDGPRKALLLGPYASHMTALANVGRGRRLAIERYPFATYGTASAATTLPTAFGR